MEQNIICPDLDKARRWLDELVPVVPHRLNEHHHELGYRIFFY